MQDRIQVGIRMLGLDFGNLLLLGAEPVGGAVEVGKTEPGQPLELALNNGRFASPTFPARKLRMVGPPPPSNR